MALDATRLHGIATNLDYLRQIIATPQFQRGDVWTRLLDEVRFQPHCLIEVLQPGTYSSVQDYPGRLGYWDIGVPPSGPMDDFAFRLANRIVGNHAEQPPGWSSPCRGRRCAFTATPPSR